MFCYVLFAVTINFAYLLGYCAVCRFGWAEVCVLIMKDMNKEDFKDIFQK